MGAPVKRYSRWQREAISATYNLPGVTARQVVETAAAGLLSHPTGATLGAFDISENTVRTIGRRARAKEATEARAAGLLEITPRDAVERLRQRLVRGIDHELTRIEAEQYEGRAVTGEELRQVARALRELAALPGPNDPRPPAPGMKVNGRREGGETRGGLTARLRAAHHADAR
jgi:hypothetical protein